MSTCGIIAASLAVLLVIIVAFLAYTAARLSAGEQQVEAAVRGWAAEYSPNCSPDITPPICVSLLSAPAAPPDPRRPPVQGFDAAASLYAVQVVSRFISFLGGAPAAQSLVQLPGLGPPSYAFIPQDSQALAATWATPDGSQVVVAIRGTATVADLVSDLEYGETVGSPLSPLVRVHRGMNAVYQGAKAALFAAIPSTAKTLFITGHSLGAAVAFLYAYDASAAGLLVEVHGIAPPRVGNAAFAAQLAAQARTSSLVNLADCIPSMPLSYMPDTSTPATPDMYAHVGPVAAFNNLRSDIVSCHAMPAYYEGLQVGPVILPQAPGTP